MNTPVRIAFILPHLRPGGAERVVVNYLRALDRTRFEPHLFLAREEGAFLDLVPHDVARVDLGGARARRLPGRTAAALEANRIDVAYSATDAVNLALLASRWRGAGKTRRIISVHTTPADRLREAKHPLFRKQLMRLLYRRAGLIAVPTDQIASELQTLLGADSLPLATLPNPVVEALSKPAPGTGKTLRIVAAGRLVEAKGFDLLIQAMAQLRTRGLHVHLSIHGDGPLRSALLEQISASRLDDAITLPGHAFDHAAIYKGADLCVVPSRREGFGNVVVEAMAAGVPVLASACPGPAGLIDHGRNGFLVEPGNSAALADAIATLLQDPVRRRLVIEAAQVTAARFEVHAATRQLESAVEALLGNQRPPTHPDPGQAIG